MVPNRIRYLEDSELNDEDLTIYKKFGVSK